MTKKKIVGFNRDAVFLLQTKPNKIQLQMEIDSRKFKDMLLMFPKQTCHYITRK